MTVRITGWHIRFLSVVLATIRRTHLHTVVLVLMQMNYTAHIYIGACLFLEISLSESCTSGLVADHQMKSTLSWAFLKGTVAMPLWQVAWMWLDGSVSHLKAEALWALMHINEIGYFHTPALKTFKGSFYSSQEHFLLDNFTRSCYCFAKSLWVKSSKCDTCQDGLFM